MKQKILQAIVFVGLIVFAGYYLTHTKVPAKPAENPGTTTNTEKPIVFISDKLGVQFEYLTDQTGTGTVDTGVKEVGDKIYVYYLATAPESGQWVQEFTKNSDSSLDEAIKKQFLEKYSETDCFVQPVEKNAGMPDNFSTATISYPPSADPNAPFWQNSDKCPADYSQANGISYFLMDNNHPDKFFFFSIGQYGIIGNLEKLQTWQETFQVTK